MFEFLVLIQLMIKNNLKPNLIYVRAKFFGDFQSNRFNHQ
jgi:hypothetical protein